MSQFSTAMTAEIKVPQQGFTLEDLRAHMKQTKVPIDALLVPALVRDVVDPENPQITTDAEFRFRAEWGA